MARPQAATGPGPVSEPGRFCSAVGMLREAADGWPSQVTEDDTPPGVVLNEAEVYERMCGNLCSCAAYPNIVSAILDAERERLAQDTNAGDMR
ncbi:hypothetical protein ACGFSI_20740 [Streptomyces virginiae]|uniref:hypothetical protein n=1 Tax=Streptomyces virginiae TaxID=1961 RepID=UPI0037201A8C